MKNEKKIREIATERIEILSHLALDILNGRGITKKEEFAHKYIKYANEIKSHYKIKKSALNTIKVCKFCKTILIPGKNCSVVISSSKRFVIYKCNKCSKELKIHY
jgi:RNase P subunit RPR2